MGPTLLLCGDLRLHFAAHLSSAPVVTVRSARISLANGGEVVALPVGGKLAQAGPE